MEYVAEEFVRMVVEWGPHSEPGEGKTAYNGEATNI